MPWAQFDDHFHDSEAALIAGPEACGLHLLATTWSAAHLTDGELPEVIVAQFVGRCEHADEMLARLVEAGLWLQTEDGWRLPGFLRDNRSREQVEKDRAAREARAKRMAEARWKKKPKKAPAAPEPLDDDLDFDA